MNDKTPEQRKAELHTVQSGSVGSVYMGLVKRALEAINEIFTSEVPKPEQAAMLGSVIGEMLSCQDDELNRSGIGRKLEAFNPMRQCFDINYVYAYEEHRKEHNLIREGQASAAEALQKVCDSHKAKKE